MNSCLSLGEMVMVVVARRIARLHGIDPVAAEADYQQQVSAMSEDERAIFDKVFLGFMITGG